MVEWDQHYRPDNRFELFTVDLSSRDAQGQFGRWLTKGGLALQYIASGGDIAEAAHRFGAISGDGKTIEAPTLSRARYVEETRLRRK